MKATLKPSKRAKLPPVPRPAGAKKPVTAAQIERELRAGGFKPTDTETKRRLKATSDWGMPDE